jgi:hypothetical protein
MCWVDMNDTLVVTASDDKTMRVHNANRWYSCTAVRGWIYTELINSVALVGNDHILSALSDHTVWVTQRFQPCPREHRAELPIFVCRRPARQPPRCVRVFLKSLSYRRAGHGRGYRQGAQRGRVPRICGGFPFARGRRAAGTAIGRRRARRRRRADGRSCVLRPHLRRLNLYVTRNMPPTSCCVKRFEQFVRDGAIKRFTIVNGTRNYWYDKVYVRSKKVCLGAEYYDVFKRQPQLSKDAIMVETVETTIAYILAYLDLPEDVHEVRGVCEQIPSAVSFLFFEQAQLDQRLSRVATKLDSAKCAKLISSLGNAVFVLIICFAAAILAAFRELHRPRRHWFREARSSRCSVRAPVHRCLQCRL